MKLKASTVWSTATALVALWAIVQLSNQMNTYRLNARPASDYLEVRSINVPDFYVGTNPPVVFDYNVVESFDGYARFAIVDMKSNKEVCSGWTLKRYEAGPPPPDPDTTLDDLMGQHCALGAGQYVVKLTMKITPDNGFVKHKPVTGNIFKVS